MRTRRATEPTLLTPVDGVSFTKLRDVVALAKPRVTAIVLLTTAGGAWLAPTHVSPAGFAWLLVGTFLVVAGANALNMLLERDTDGLMTRTKDRPLPAGRLSPKTVLGLGVASSVVSLPVLGFGVNATTAVLAALANLLYVFAYTPLKRRTHLALLVGAVPGAIPPLLGWTAATGRVEPGGLVLFAILYFWQLPHFHAIAIFRQQEYDRAGLEVMPSARGVPATRRAILASMVAVAASSALLAPLHVVRPGYLPTAIVLGAAFLGVGIVDGVRGGSAKVTFVASIAYLVALFTAIVLFAG